MPRPSFVQGLIVQYQLPWEHLSSSNTFTSYLRIPKKKKTMSTAPTVPELLERNKYYITLTTSFPRRPLKASQRQYAANSLPLPLLSELSPAGLVLISPFIQPPTTLNSLLISLQSPAQIRAVIRNTSWGCGQLVCHEQYGVELTC